MKLFQNLFCCLWPEKMGNHQFILKFKFHYIYVLMTAAFHYPHLFITPIRVEHDLISFFIVELHASFSSNYIFHNTLHLCFLSFFLFLNSFKDSELLKVFFLSLVLSTVPGVTTIKKLNLPLLHNERVTKKYFHSLPALLRSLSYPREVLSSGENILKHRSNCLLDLTICL